MSDGGPPSSWYDPPEPKHDLEIKWESDLPFAVVTCEREGCGEAATVEGEIGDVRYSHGRHFTYCKGHYDSIFEDEIEALENYEPDYEED